MVPFSWCIKWMSLRWEETDIQSKPILVVVRWLCYPLCRPYSWFYHLLTAVLSPAPSWRWRLRGDLPLHRYDPLAVGTPVRWGRASQNLQLLPPPCCCWGRPLSHPLLKGNMFKSKLSQHSFSKITLQYYVLHGWIRWDHFLYCLTLQNKDEATLPPAQIQMEVFKMSTNSRCWNNHFHNVYPLR